MNLNAYLDPDCFTKHSPEEWSCNKKYFSTFLLYIPDVHYYYSFFVWRYFVARNAALPLLPADNNILNMLTQHMQWDHKEITELVTHDQHEKNVTQMHSD